MTTNKDKKYNLSINLMLLRSQLLENVTLKLSNYIDNVKQSIADKHEAEAIKAINGRLRNKQICFIQTTKFDEAIERNLRGYRLTGPVYIDHTLLNDTSVYANNLAKIQMLFKPSNDWRYEYDNKLASTLALCDGTVIVYDFRREHQLSKLIKATYIQQHLRIQELASTRLNVLRKLYKYFANKEDQLNERIYEKIF